MVLSNWKNWGICVLAFSVSAQPTDSAETRGWYELKKMVVIFPKTTGKGNYYSELLRVRVRVRVRARVRY